MSARTRLEVVAKKYINEQIKRDGLNWDECIRCQRRFFRPNADHLSDDYTNTTNWAEGEDFSITDLNAEILRQVMDGADWKARAEKAEEALFMEREIINGELGELKERAENAEAALEDIPIMRQAVRRSRANEKHWKERFLEQKKLAEAHHRLTIQVKAERDWLAKELSWRESHDRKQYDFEYWLKRATLEVTKHSKDEELDTIIANNLPELYLHGFDEKDREEV